MSTSQRTTGVCRLHAASGRAFSVQYDQHDKQTDVQSALPKAIRTAQHTCTTQQLLACARGSVTEADWSRPATRPSHHQTPPVKFRGEWCSIQVNLGFPPGRHN
jgi:hypothetical protein